MIDWRDYKFVGLVGFCQYACVIIHSALVDVIINPNLIPLGSPYCLQLAPKEYLKELPNGLCFHLTLCRVFTSQKRRDLEPGEAQVIAKNTMQAFIAWAILSCSILVVVVLLFAFDISVPPIRINVEVNATRIILEASQIQISSLQLSWKELRALKPLKVFYILFRCNLSVCTDGVSLKWTAVEGNIETGLSMLWYGILKQLTTFDARKGISRFLHVENTSKLERIECFEGACARAITVRVDKLTLNVEPNRIPASLYLTLKDLLSSHCTSNSKNPISSAKLSAIQNVTSERAHNTIHNIQFPGLSALLLCIRKVHISVTDLIPSLVHTIRIKDIQYQRTQCGSYESVIASSSQPGQLVEHLVRISLCEVFSTKYASNTIQDHGDRTNTAAKNLPYDRGSVKGAECKRERLCSLRATEAVIIAVHRPLAKVQILKTRMKIGSMYMLPTDVSKQTNKTSVMTSISVDQCCARAEVVAKGPQAVIVYKEFVSIFAC